MCCASLMQGLAGAPSTTHICLQPFTAQEAAALVAHIFEGTAAPAAFLAQVLPFSSPAISTSKKACCSCGKCLSSVGSCRMTGHREVRCHVQAASAIYERSCGLPLFIQEMAVHLRQVRPLYAAVSAVQVLSPASFRH